MSPWAVGNKVPTQPKKKRTTKYLQPMVDPVDPEIFVGSTQVVGFVSPAGEVLKGCTERLPGFLKSINYPFY